MTRVTVVGAACLVTGYLAGMAAGTADEAAGQAPQAAQAAGGAAPAWATIPIAPDQGEPVHWPADLLQKTHAELSARSKGRILSKPRDLLPLPITRTHMFDVVHRPPASGVPTAEQHEGVTDLYVVLGGSGRLTVGGTIAGRKPIANRPGEYLGSPIEGGRTYEVKAGDIVNVPPNTPHASQGDAGGLTYMLIKINVGLYPWSIVSGAQ